MKFSEQLKSGVILDNPVFMQTIGLCPTLATTTSLQNAIGMGAHKKVRIDGNKSMISKQKSTIIQESTYLISSFFFKTERSSL